MKRLIGWTGAWIFYWVGDTIYQTIHRLDWSRDGIVEGALYRVWNWFLLKSIDLQNWGDCGCDGPWCDCPGRTHCDDDSQGS